MGSGSTWVTRSRNVPAAVPSLRHNSAPETPSLARKYATPAALIMVNEGVIFEFSSKCVVPIQHKAGDISRELPMAKRSPAMTKV